MIMIHYSHEYSCFTNSAFYTHFETQNSAPICTHAKRTYMLLRCALGMYTKQFVFADGPVFSALNLR